MLVPLGNLFVLMLGYFPLEKSLGTRVEFQRRLSQTEMKRHSLVCNAVSIVVRYVPAHVLNCVEEQYITENSIGGFCKAFDYMRCWSVPEKTNAAPLRCNFFSK